MLPEPISSTSFDAIAHRFRKAASDHDDPYNSIPMEELFTPSL